MKAARRILDTIVGAACCLILAVMVVVLAWQVFSRYAINTPSTFSEEVLRYGMIWSSFLGAAFACSRGSHMAISLIPDMARGRTGFLLRLMVPVSFIVFSILVMIVGGVSAVKVAGGQYSAVLRIPMVWVYAAMPVGGAFMLIYSILNLADRFLDTREGAGPVGKAMTTGE
ncbi:MAG: TRAP transporter small permease [Tropicimonas sp.]|uniref:TRAP transporter small permease n=1 Tax=Tropicimonas sp. TaxID=2067044 RepID=UPI003A84A5A3